VEFRYEFSGLETVVQVEAIGDDFAVTVSGRTFHVKASASRPGELDLELEDGRSATRVVAWVAADGARRWVALGPAYTAGQPFVLTIPEAGRRPRGGLAGAGQALEAQMPGVVRRVLIAAGDEVERGQVLMLLEAMKMEIRVTAPHAGRVERVEVVEGQAVDRGQTLATLKGRT
jgi:biotin carboxyl carrier protein